MAVPLSQPLNQAAWRATCGADPAMISWLQEAGLLTQRLRTLCGSEFCLEVLTEGMAASAGPVRREVMLCCASEPCIYALTEIPTATVKRHVWLRELGAASLGETLREQSRTHGVTLSRSAFEFALLKPDQLPQPAAAQQQQPAWARRSLFRLNEDLLTVTEIFLHGLLDCERRRVRAAS